ncbi:hypothetical protein QAD02_019550 [Eretmocerus hayati]|uniref:Uncharacterized protein n=1 Tax=Eretmocerus hayati TaxID=131215 RepID=A0ACC2PL13_9HYME|nr:hypothetical protein QAD02_019550 [Eretmocerus hayati]
MDESPGVEEYAENRAGELVTNEATANAERQPEQRVDVGLEGVKPDSFEISPNPDDHMEADSLWKSARLANEKEELPPAPQQAEANLDAQSWIGPWNWAQTMK